MMRFGILINMDKIVIGEYRATVNGVSEAGKVHVFNNEGEHLWTLLTQSCDK